MIRVCYFYTVICSVFMSNFIQIIYSRLLLSRAISESAWYVNGEGSRGSGPQSCYTNAKQTTCIYRNEVKDVTTTGKVKRVG
jgi:hypothetical protein